MCFESRFSDWKDTGETEEIGKRLLENGDFCISGCIRRIVCRTQCRQCARPSRRRLSRNPGTPRQSASNYSFGHSKTTSVPALLTSRWLVLRTCNLQVVGPLASSCLVFVRKSLGSNSKIEF